MELYAVHTYTYNCINMRAVGRWTVDTIWTPSNETPVFGTGVYVCARIRVVRCIRYSYSPSLLQSTRSFEYLALHCTGVQGITLYCTGMLLIPESGVGSRESWVRYENTCTRSTGTTRTESTQIAKYADTIAARTIGAPSSESNTYDVDVHRVLLAACFNQSKPNFCLFQLGFKY